MKQAALKTLLTALGYTKPLFDINVYTGLGLEGIRTICGLLKSVKPEEKDGDRFQWPPFRTTVSRESQAEFQAEYPEDDQSDLKEYIDVHMPHEEAWIYIQFVQEKQGEYEIRIYPHDVFLMLNLADNTVLMPRGIHETTKIQILLDWIACVSSREIKTMTEDYAEYRSSLEQRLPYRERFGKIRRKHMWACTPGTHYIRDELTPGEGDLFCDIVSEVKEGGLIQDITAKDFLRFCEICYSGAGMACSSEKDAADSYTMHADGRHDGLLDIPRDDPSAFHTWLKAPKYGHPWEIARGGNWTHISLQAVWVQSHERVYKLILRGTAVTRSAEAIRMTLALHGAGIPVCLADADRHLLRIRGIDWVGVLPDYYSGIRHPGQLFPKEDQVYDAYTYSNIAADNPAIGPYIEWSPLVLPEPLL